MDPNSLDICGFADASFSGNADHSSQIGMAIVLKDRDNNAALIHYGSWKCRRVTRSVFTAEVHVFTDCMDYVLGLQHDLSSILGKKVLTVVYKDSKCLFDIITKLSSVSEKRLLINIASIREEYTCGSLSNVAHVSSEFNLADPFTKDKGSQLLWQLMHQGTLRHPVNQWIVHQ